MRFSLPRPFPVGRLRGPRFTDADLGAAIQAALTGLIQSAA